MQTTEIQSKRRLSNVWEPIEDLPSDFETLSDGELNPLLRVWHDLRTELQESSGLDRFRRELEREWAIETGQIEGIYDIERGVTQTLIERGISADLIPHTPGQRQPELIAAILRDHTNVLDGLFQFVKSERKLSKSYINEIHAALLRHQPTATAVDQFGNVFETELLKGRYKLQPNNPTKPDGTKHLYCPPEHVDAEMDRLIEMHSSHLLMSLPIEIQAAWLHHRFTQVHPYQDGNGRVARAMATLLFIKAGWFPVVVTRDDRVRYLDALEAADDGDLSPLIACFVDIQKRTLFQATKIGTHATPVATVDEAIKSVKRVLTWPACAVDPSIWAVSRRTADRLMDLAQLRFGRLKEALVSEIKSAMPGFSVSGESYPVASSLEAGFVANPTTYDRSFSLFLQTERPEDSRRINIWAFGIGTSFRGLIGISVSFSRSGLITRRCSDSPFQVNYAESASTAEARFHPWLERSLIQALILWRQSL